MRSESHSPFRISVSDASAAYHFNVNRPQTFGTGESLNEKITKARIGR